MWSSISFSISSVSWRQHSTAQLSHRGLLAKTKLLPTGEGSLFCPQSIVSWQGIRECQASLGTLATLGLLWDQMSEQQWKLEHFVDSINTTCGRAYWKAAAFHSLIRMCLIEEWGPTVSKINVRQSSYPGQQLAPPVHFYRFVGHCQCLAIWFC